MGMFLYMNVLAFVQMIVSVHMARKASNGYAFVRRRIIYGHGFVLLDLDTYVVVKDGRQCLF